jgi:hypothetical protein
MQISKYDLLTEADLLSRLKRIRLRGFDRAEVYRDATLEVIETDPERLVPAQGYVLQDDVQAILDVADAFAPLGVDVFALRGALLFWLQGSKPEEAPIPFLPPVIEESVEADGKTVLLINDGIHRVYAARKRGRKINVVLARNVPAHYPYYAYPLPGGWKQVEELTELPKGYKKKEYRDPVNHKALFRDFDEVLPVSASEAKTLSARIVRR